MNEVNAYVAGSSTQAQTTSTAPLDGAAGLRRGERAGLRQVHRRQPRDPPGLPRGEPHGHHRVRRGEPGGAASVPPAEPAAVAAYIATNPTAAQAFLMQNETAVAQYVASNPAAAQAYLTQNATAVAAVHHATTSRAAGLHRANSAGVSAYIASNPAAQQAFLTANPAGVTAYIAGNPAALAPSWRPIRLRRRTWPRAAPASRRTCGQLRDAQAFITGDPTVLQQYLTATRRRYRSTSPPTRPCSSSTWQRPQRPRGVPRDQPVGRAGVPSAERHGRRPVHHRQRGYATGVPDHNSVGLSAYILSSPTASQAFLSANSAAVSAYIASNPAAQQAYLQGDSAGSRPTSPATPPPCRLRDGLSRLQSYSDFGRHRPRRRT